VELARFPESRFATLERGGGAGSCRGLRRGALERGGGCLAGLRGVRIGRTVYLGRGLGFFESFAFLQIGRRLLDLVGRIAGHVFCVLRVIQSLIRVPLIMVSDSSPRAFVGMSISPAEA
jgi:hypothetical protein